ncbi:MAG TPA: hypothetical protein VJ436_07385 [Anaerolineales bacterium]|nr:hypothetical protein [Anaerolineales bacterium]
MHYLEAVDARDRLDGTPKLQRLRQIPPETGKLLALLAASAPAGEFLEIGTSGGFFVADNLISHAEELKSFRERVLADERVDALVIPIGKGVLVCRKSVER